VVALIKPNAIIAAVTDIMPASAPTEATAADVRAVMKAENAADIKWEERRRKIED
jgi:hypothetical protein